MSEYNFAWNELVCFSARHGRTTLFGENGQLNCDILDFCTISWTSLRVEEHNGQLWLRVVMARGVFLAAGGWVEPPPPLAGHGSPKVAGGGNLAKIKENEEKRPRLGSLGVQAIPF